MSFPRYPGLLLAVALFAARGASAQAGEQGSKAAWPPITAEARPWVRWWWMGSAVDAPNLDRELARYQKAGLGGVEVTPIYGVKGGESRQIPYLTPRWMQMLEHAIAEGKRLGLVTDMTTGTGWCFGGPTVSETDANALVVPTKQVVQPGATLTGTFNPAGTQALMAFGPSGKRLDLKNKIGSDGRVDWVAEGGPWDVYGISQKPSGVTVKRAAPGGAGPMLNLIYPEAVTRYLRWFEEPFQTTQPKLRALFQDSYEYNSNWAPDFFERFEKLRGYSLATELPALLGTEQDERAARVKSDYRETISDIMASESIPIWVRWSHAHGFLTRYQAHGAPGNLLDLYGDSDIPETEMFHKDRNVLVSKFASSAAHLTGKNLTSAETGTWLAEHFTETLAAMKYLVDDLFISGINHVVYHGTAYAPDDAAWPGWCFYASTEMNPRNAIWHDVAALNGYVARCQSILQSGTADNDLLLYWPVYDYWNDASGMVRGFSISGKGWLEGQPVGVTAHHLFDRGFTFDYVSDHQLASVDASRRVIVVPPCALMPLATLQQLLSLSSKGATVIFQDKLPQDVPGWGGLAERRKQFQSLLQTIRLTDSESLNAAVVGQGKILVGDLEAALASAHVPRASLVDHPGIHFIRRACEDGRYTFVANRGNQPLNDWLTLGSPAGSVELMDPMTEKTGLGRTRMTAGGQAEVFAQVEPGESIIIRTSSNKAADGAELWQYRSPAGPAVELTGAWDIKFIDGGPTLPAPIHTEKLASWTALGGDSATQTFAGTALYTLAFTVPKGTAGSADLDLGTVCQSARVRLNGKALGTVFTAPYRVYGVTLLPGNNVLEVEVTSTSANRIRDLDVRKVQWKIFNPPNVLSAGYGAFDASRWPVADAGLLGPVTITPETK